MQDDQPMSDAERDGPAESDRSLLVYARWDARTRESLRSLITDGLIAEHRGQPRGQHSDTLARVLNYFRRAPLTRKYVVVCIRPHVEWKIAELSGVRGDPPRVIDDRSFASEAEALHAVFLQRVDDLMRS